MNKTLLSETNVNDTFSGYLLVKQANVAKTVNQTDYIALELSDTSDTISAKKWDATPLEIQQMQAGTIVSISGYINEYKGMKQININTIQALTPTNNNHVFLSDNGEEINISELLQKAPMSIDEMQTLIDKTIQDIKNPTIQRITHALIERYHHEFYTHPAAIRNHHAYYSGLAYHTTTMLLTAKALTDVYDGINTDLLFAGVILHDLGKIYEYSDAVDTHITLEGNLLGHIPSMTVEIAQTATQLHINPKDEAVMLLQHMVLSHHGIPEWGSARRPIVKEAILLHHIDNIDAKINMLNHALSSVNKGEYTPKIYALDNQQIYKPTL